MQKDLRAALTVVLGYVPSVAEVRQALARTEDGPKGLPRATHADWAKSGRDRNLDAIYSIASYYHGRKAFDGQTLEFEDVRYHLEVQLGWRREESEGETVEQCSDDP